VKALFVGARGKRIAPGVVGSRLNAWARRRGLSAHVHPHMLRHSFATHVLQSSQDLRAVQEMLGHASISSTQVYTHLDFQALAKVYDAGTTQAGLELPIKPQNGTMPPQEESDFYPYGSEIPIMTGDSNHYKFTGSA